TYSIVLKFHLKGVPLLPEDQGHIPRLTVFKGVGHRFLKYQVCFTAVPVGEFHALPHQVMGAETNIHLLEKLFAKISDVDKKLGWLVIDRIDRPYNSPRSGVKEF